METARLVLWLALTSVCVCDRQTAEMTTHLGKLRGHRESVLGTMVDYYLGIPYGQRPMGEQRFQRPQAYGSWKGEEWDATRMPNACPQAIDTSLGGFEGVTMWNPNTNISEDCLYLNVWTPGRANQKPKTVLVWIFGGGFYAGTTGLEWYDARILAAKGDVVVVSMQYRIGAAGFLYLGIPGAPGNMGLLDQQLALQWVADNIADYGGDPASVTLFGESAGAASVSFHMLSPLSRDLFKRGITQSSTALSKWSMDPPEMALKRSLSVAREVGCEADSMEDVLACLMDVPHEQLTDAMWTVGAHDQSILQTPFAPTIDNYFISRTPLEMFSEGDYKKGSVLMGVNKDEGAYFLPFVLPNMYNISHKDSVDLEQEYLIATRKVLHAENAAVAEAVAFEYSVPYNYRDNVPFRDMLDDILGDFCFICPMVMTAQTMAEDKQDVYFYQYSHVTSQSPWPPWMGALHGYEIDIVFGLPLNDSYDYREDEKELSERIIQYWTNFAKTGNPVLNEDTTIMDSKWPTYTNEDRNIAVLNTSALTLRDGLRDRKCTFWGKLIPKLRDHVEACAGAATLSISICGLLLSVLAAVSYISLSHVVRPSNS